VATTNNVQQWFPAREEFLPREEFHDFRAGISRLVHGNWIPMGIPWETTHGMGWDSTHLYFPRDSEIE